MEDDVRDHPPASPTSRFRLYLVSSGLLGLLACGLLTAACVWLVTQDIIGILLPHREVALLLSLILGGFSLAEVPMMVFVMRRLLVERPNNHAFVLGLNAVFVFFAAVYGVPVLLLTGSLSLGLTLCSLGLVRFGASLIFVRAPVAPDASLEGIRPGRAQPSNRASGESDGR
jgi:hypothetical protein